MNKNIFIAIVLSTFSVLLAQPDWEYNPGDFEFTSWIVAGMVLSDGQNLAAAGDIFAAFDANDNVAFTNGGLMFLFSNAKYELNGQEIENVNNPGIAGCLLGTAKYPRGYAMKGIGLMQC